jgi:hypothetical protein
VFELNEDSIIEGAKYCSKGLKRQLLDPDDTHTSKYSKDALIVIGPYSLEHVPKAHGTRRPVIDIMVSANETNMQAIAKTKGVLIDRTCICNKNIQKHRPCTM